MEKRIRSVCRRYIAVINDKKYDNPTIIDTKKKITFERGCTQVGKNYYAKRHAITGVSAHKESNGSRKYFTVRFADGKEGMLIKAFSGNTIIRSYEAIFKYPKEDL